MNASQTRLAILGTMSDLHRQPISYDLNCLQKVVADLAPDLLCAEITQEAWESADFSQTSLEVREALAPTIASMDIVLICEEYQWIWVRHLLSHSMHADGDVLDEKRSGNLGTAEYTVG